MWEMLYVAASCRLPIVLACINRACPAPSTSTTTIPTPWAPGMPAGSDHAENAQEAYDNYIMSFRIGEHKDVLLPVMARQDGIITSHAVDNITLLEDEKVKAFVGEYKPEKCLLNPAEALSVGPYDTVHLHGA